jgi:adenosylcobinamide-phosphate synthase
MDTWPGHAVVPALALVVAMLVDVCWGEPPMKWHPVVWMGCFLEHAGRWVAPRAGVAVPANDHGAFVRGALAWLAGAAGVLGVAWGLQWLLESLPVWVAVPCVGLLLKSMLSWQMLRGEVRAVGLALGHSLSAGRERLAWLCSRDVQQLDATQVRETAIETLAENLSDSVVAPLFWFALAGLPGAALYRFANTADAMWGYRGARGGRCWEWAGKWAARADDVLSWVPARLTAALLMLAGGRLFVPGLSREAQHTLSPNSGWPMGAMALLLGVRLGKPGVYLLNSHGRGVLDGDIEQACRLAARTVWLSVPLCWLIVGGLHV